MELREYQREAVLGARKALKDHRSALVVMPTGTGKTVVFADLVKRFLERYPNKKVLVLAHRGELLTQAMEKIVATGSIGRGQVGLEMATSSAPDTARVVCGSVQTMRNGRLESFPRDHFGIIVVDEAHHAVAESYLKILEHFEGAWILGFTATPDRLDKKALGQVFGKVAYTYEIIDAINDKWLVPITARLVQVNSLDLNRVKRYRNDFSEASLAVEMSKKPTLYEVVRPTLEQIKTRKALVFAASVEHAEELTKVFNEHTPNIADFLSGADKMDRRRSVLNHFRRGGLQVLVNCQLFTEGVDVPSISAIVMARPTQSRSLYSQMIGRGLRPLDGKEDCLVVDFTDNVERHNLVTAVDIMTDESDEEVKNSVRKMASEEEVDLMKAIEKANELEAEKARARALEEVSYTIRGVDPFHAIGLHIRRSCGGIPATHAQRDVLKKCGIDCKGISKKQASKIIDRLIERSKQGLCTPKQARTMLERGLNPDVTFETAMEAINAIANNRWVTPKWLKLDPRFRKRNDG